jgi:hypothetical protein
MKGVDILIECRLTMRVEADAQNRPAAHARRSSRLY